MKRTFYVDVILDQTRRALWEVSNVIDCVPDEYWNREYCDMPLWKHIYHMLHSLDQWFINPRDRCFREPLFHEQGLNDLDTVSAQQLTRQEITLYFAQVKQKILCYLEGLNDNVLLERPEGCEFSRFTLILAQHRHLHTHMGMLMGFIVCATGRWPRVVGLEGSIPVGPYSKYF